MPILVWSFGGGFSPKLPIKEKSKEKPLISSTTGVVVFPADLLSPRQGRGNRAFSSDVEHPSAPHHLWKPLPSQQKKVTLPLDGTVTFSGY